MLGPNLVLHDELGYQSSAAAFVGSAFLVEHWTVDWLEVQGPLSRAKWIEELGCIGELLL